MSIAASKRLFTLRWSSSYLNISSYCVSSPPNFVNSARHLGSRFFATATSSGTPTDNPYRVLNVPINSTYETVKAAFLKAALQHHPDHSKEPDTTAFLRVRQAFEAIAYVSRSQDGDDGGADTAGKRKPSWKSDAEFQEWFRANTGEFLSFEMNHQTRQEVIRVYRTMSSGGRDKGGYWEMARLLAEREDAVGSGESDSVVGKLSPGVPPPGQLRPRKKRSR